MLNLQVPYSAEAFDDDKQEFIPPKTVDVVLEHSLVSLSKWESRFEKPFLSEAKRTDEETLGYIDCMIISAEIPPGETLTFSNENIKRINEYINAKMTATWINDLPNPAKPKQRKETITSELLYYWMIKMQIPFECQNWHLARLLMLIQVYNAKEAPETKQSKQDIASRQRLLNEQRRAQYKTSG